MNLIQDNITQDFQLLAGTLSPVEALELLTDKYGVVLDEHSKPVALVTADDLIQAAKQDISSLLDTKVEFLPTMIDSCKVNMQDLVNRKGFIEQYEKIRGVIVIDDNTVVGILAVTTVRKYLNNLNNRDYELRGNQRADSGDSTLAGDPQLPKIEFKCGECNFDNKLNYIDWNNLPDCQNSKKPDHKLKFT